ncbi:MAG: hypothetical protein J6V44_12495 [Methanobrevibacter sp.]|nr:hypothetical protein [Methanobrevibacter sp.]
MFMTTNNLITCSLSKNANLNYVATIVNVSTFAPHPHADRLKLAKVNGCSIAMHIDSQPGLYIYFPLESQLSDHYLKTNNLFRKGLNLNIDQEKSGFFEASGRVKCVKLRQLYSEGFIMPVDSLKDAYGGVLNVEVGTKFDTIHYDNTTDQICKKYVIQQSVSRSGTKVKNATRKYDDVIVPQQFRFHPDTPKLKECLHQLKPTDYIHISYKMHGTSAIFCNLLVNRDLKWYENLLLRFGIKVETEEYKKFCSSRKVIKDPDLNQGLSQGYYDVDIWNLALDVIKEHLYQGLTIYAEIVGYLPTGAMIQKGYDYGCTYDPKLQYSKMTPIEMYNKGLFRIYVYRITQTSPDGKVMEMSATDLQQYCLETGLMPVPELWFGQIGPDVISEASWTDKFLEKLSIQYLEKDCYMCNNKVPEEGIVIRTMKPNFEAFKLKSLRFFERETKELDAGITNIEDNQ